MQQGNFQKQLRKIDLKATPARVAVLKLLKETKQPIDVNTIIDKINKWGIKTDPTTVFRIVNKLTERGVVNQIQFQDKKARYELTEREHHHHFICEDCGEIEDVLADAIPALEREIGRKQGFLVKRHSLEFFGLCSNCQK